MPRLTPGVRSANAGIILLEDGDYIFDIGTPKTFSRKNQENEDVFGVSMGLLVKEGSSNVGKTIPNQLFLHTEGSLGMTKRFLMAALGYNPNDPTQEEDFNAKFNDEAFEIDTDSNFLGEVYQRLAGNSVAATVKQQLSKPKPGSGREPQLQNQFNWRPVS